MTAEVQAEDLQEQAREVYRQSVAAELPVDWAAARGAIRLPGVVQELDGSQ